jgi:large subunit ribosomal protein L13
MTSPAKAYSATTYSAKPGDIEKTWVLIDAEGAILGRLASLIAQRLRGKHKPGFTPHVDCGDNVIVVNAAKVRLTGDKADQKIFYWHTGYPGGIKGQSQGERLKSRYPERVLRKAVERMLPKESPLARRQLRNLKVYQGPDHPHAAQEPQRIDFRSLNPKNTSRSE